MGEGEGVREMERKTLQPPPLGPTQPSPPPGTSRGRERARKEGRGSGREREGGRGGRA